MKSAHRHELQTNALAQRLEVAIERVRPYGSTIVGTIAAIIIVILGWSYFSNSSTSKRGEAWNVYHQAVGAVPPNLNELHQFAQDYPGSQMQQMADITWADGQVFEASVNYLYNRSAAMKSLEQAANVYQSTLRTSDDERLANRAHLGMARIYEMRNDPVKAREEYLKVGGGYTEYAKAEAERLATPESKDTYAWLAKAEPVRTQPPAGPGRPGEQPEFSAGDLSLPDASQAAEGTGSNPADAATSFDEILKNFQLEKPTNDATTDPNSGTGLPVPGETVPTTPPATESTTTPPAADATAAPPATESSTAAPATEEKPAE
jgi:hypothetical protein